MSTDQFLFYGDMADSHYMILPPDEAKHAFNVLRIAKGDQIFITDGRGFLYTCEVTELEGVRNICTIRQKEERSRLLPEIHLYVGVPEKEAFETLLSAVIPLGVTAIHPIICQHCQKSWWSKWNKLSERFQKKSVVAVKQSWNTLFPQIHEPVKFSSLKNIGENVTLLADQQGSTIVDLQPHIENVSKLDIFIGPPGAFSRDELEQIQTGKCHSVKLGNARLRTELAATVLTGAVVSLL